MDAALLHASTVVVAAYAVAGAAHQRVGRVRTPVLALVPPAVAVAVTWGSFSGPTIFGLVLVWGVAGLGMFAKERVSSAGWWLAAQGVVFVVLAGLGAWIVGPAEVSANVAAVAVVTTGISVAVEWGGEFVGRAVSPFSTQESKEGASREGNREGGDATGEATQTGGGHPKGGQMIGRLERLLIVLFVFANAPTAIGFLVTAKSILRFGEIKDRDAQKEAEYIIIGTLMSFGVALVVSYLARLTLGAIAPGVLGTLSLGS